MKIKNQRPHIGLTQHSYRRKEISVKPEAKENKPVEFQDPKFTVTFLIQNKNGQWHPPTGVPGFEATISWYKSLYSFSDLLDLWRPTYEPLRILCNKYGDPRFAARRLKKDGPLALSDNALESGILEDFLKLLLLDKDIKTSKIPQYLLVLYWEYPGEQVEQDADLTEGDDHDNVISDHHDISRKRTRVSRKRIREPSPAEITPHIKTEPISPGNHSNQRARHFRRPFWATSPTPEPTPANNELEALPSRTEPLIENTNEDELVTSEELGNDDEEDHADQASSLGDSMQAKIADNDESDVPAANTRRKHGITVPKKQF
ncbi:hypothetical protein PISL3812_09922 [Talaromyces islandicus]|uniref:Uncharacterized protein n=1 Tax=Talaromyces islandicus TaxID=28573 RepID=A0A0U1MCK7_TALIS|nr:hypothetical protein PISL3812_09922 [Talaromyces islandicus]